MLGESRSSLCAQWRATPPIGCPLFPDDGEINADDFEAADVSSLIVNPDSGQVRK
jgi:hypothetical protein